MKKSNIYQIPIMVITSDFC